MENVAVAAVSSLEDNATIREYLELRLGPQHILLPIVIPLTVLYVVVFVSGVVGNVTVCLVIARNSHFQTPTNYYLFSLAISDLLILVFVRVFFLGAQVSLRQTGAVSSQVLQVDVKTVGAKPSGTFSVLASLSHGP
ncbi:hypothetical protein V5799_021288 [Amblyomma americanum]|uniref:G-protein coupled receptors family 1 profile domain-containing protein n=1 Tax=Amblyomma americanum TaxID=6943 RepID=A0AAQ4FPE0_AMBAM